MAESKDKEEVPATSETLNRPLFRCLDAGSVEELETSELESLCLACGENGVTRLLLTKIPMFHDVIVMSFFCPHCGNSNNEIQDSSPIQSDGIRFTVTVNKPQDLNRLVVKADKARLVIPSLEFEIPPGTQRGSINTLEGFIQLSITELEQDQPARRATHPDIAAKLDEFIVKLKNCIKLDSPFTVIIDDPSGNSFVENKLQSLESDSNVFVEQYKRSDEQDRQLGILDSSTKGESSNETGTQADEGRAEESGLSHDEVMSFVVNCPNCQMSASTNMKVVDVPQFKEVIIMALVCEYCGHKSNDVKSGSGISEKGKRIELHLTDPADLSRDILKAETACLLIPELEFELRPGTLGGRFTTIEGILNNIKDQLSSANPFVTGDTASGGKLADFIKTLDEISKGRRLGIHIILDDPAGNSHLQNFYAPDEDPEMKVEYYERTFEQNDELGLNDIKTEEY